MEWEDLISEEAKEWIAKEAVEKVVCTQSELAKDAPKDWDCKFLKSEGITRKRLSVQAEEQFYHLPRHLEFHEKLIQHVSWSLSKPVKLKFDSSLWLCTGMEFFEGRVLLQNPFHLSSLLFPFFFLFPRFRQIPEFNFKTTCEYGEASPKR